MLKISPGLPTQREINADVFFLFFRSNSRPGTAELEQPGSSRKSEMEQQGAKATSRGVGATSLGGNLNVVVVI